MAFLQNTKKRDMRRAYPITGYVGPNGGGKSAAMVWDTLPTLVAGRRVLSTVRILDFENPRPCEGWEVFDGQRVDCSICYAAVTDPDGELYAHGQAHELYEKLTEWAQLIEAKRCDVLLDEVTGVASSRESHGMPSPVANKLVQLRRADVVVRWSAPSWARADKIIRECSQSVTFCQGFFSKKVEDEGGARLWSQRRLFKWRSFDAQLFEDFTVGKREQLGAMFADWHWGPKSPAFAAYDTYDSVATVGTVTDHGACYHCGGSRPRPKCTCAETKATGAAGAVGAPAESARAEPEHSTGAPSVTTGRRRRLDVVHAG